MTHLDMVIEAADRTAQAFEREALKIEHAESLEREAIALASAAVAMKLFHEELLAIQAREMPR